MKKNTFSKLNAAETSKNKEKKMVKKCESWEKKQKEQ